MLLHREWLRARRAVFGNDFQNLGDDFSRFMSKDSVSDADITVVNKGFIVQGRSGYGGS